MTQRGEVNDSAVRLWQASFSPWMQRTIKTPGAVQPGSGLSCLLLLVLPEKNHLAHQPLQTTVRGDISGASAEEKFPFPPRDAVITVILHNWSSWQPDLIENVPVYSREVELGEPRRSLPSQTIL